ncbi:type 1 glutamine amidotransferase domain-containing protein [Photobacterium sp. TLY01]|uniref:type 1 glutamine amidotransferase domain-containing protein n=1 Tax=Photobacterium sp. TLY01 TaxID=2907534 RepID=UPI001F21E9AF|nr:type 1 glutamine amidotransferase domain-containing protein [Photobacterium sp. TLY01]UIP29083.1 type 1 glutamine amidotransferase domain-containing protein [Photobacterium sp. TLY01]
MKVLMILTSHDKLGDTDHQTGFWLEEFTTPYYTLADAGAEITLASPKGGLPPIDPRSQDESSAVDSTRRYASDQVLQSALSHTFKLAEMDASEFDAVFYPGGHGPLWDLADDKDSIALIEQFYAQGKPVGAVCHGPAVFKSTRNTQGEPLVSGKRVTGFSNEEEAAVELTDIVPFLVEDMLKANGGLYVKKDNWQSHVVTDGLLITGQNPNSSQACAQSVLDALNAK